ncbi:MAG TPA: hypothetical protein PLG31_00775 [Spirochaetota bacterium]|nr:hypothetical protein [Spirochaetota bacterium]HPU90396.1 hypothetical protein [Spirochaetota bacterium]
MNDMPPYSQKRFNLRFLPFLMLAVYTVCIACNQQDIFEALTSKNETAAKTLHWQFVDGTPTTAVGLNHISSYDAQDVHLLVFNNQLYAAWAERNGNAGNPYQIRVARYNGDRTWALIDGSGANGLNANASLNAFSPHLGIYAGSLYIAWNETNGTEARIRVKRYDGGAIWTFVDGGCVGDGINYAANGIGYNAYSPRIAEFGSFMMVTWHETNGTADQVRVRYYNGANWLWADPGGTTGINFDTGVIGRNPQSVIFNSSLYCTWYEYDGGVGQIRIRSYNGVWAWEDGATAIGINVSAARFASYPTMMVFNSKLYALWEEGNISAVQQIRFGVYTGGGVWNKLNTDVNCGINYNCAQNARRPSMAVCWGSLHLAWYETNGSGFNQIQVMTYNGNDASPDGISITGQSNPEYGLNYNPSMNAAYPVLVGLNDNLYVAWYESNGTANQIRVAAASWY